MATKSPEATVEFLMACMENTEGKTDWEAVAVKTGMYKAGKFSKQAYATLQKKYTTTTGPANAAVAKDIVMDGEETKKTTTKAPNKRAAEDDGKKKGRTK